MIRPLSRRVLSLILALLFMLSLPVKASAVETPRAISLPELAVMEPLPLDTMDEYGGALYGIGNGQLFRSSDGGTTWTGRNRQFHIDAYDLLLVDEKTWLVGNKQGIFRSEDGGMSWVRVTNEFILYGYRMLRYQDRILLVAVSNENWTWDGSYLFESRDKGQTWSKVSKLARTAREICTNTSQTALWAVDDTAWSTSADNGKSWTQLTTPPSEVPAGATCRPGGQRKGATPLPKVTQPAGSSAVVSSLVRTPNGTLLYVDQSDWVYRRPPTGRWERVLVPSPQYPKTARYTPAATRSLAAGPDGTVYLSGAGQLLRSTDGGAHWEGILPPAPGILFLQNLTVTASGRLFVSIARQTDPYIYEELATTADGGKSWRVMTQANCVSLWSTGTSVACLDGAPKRARFRLSTDDGVTWTDWWLPKQSEFSLYTQGQFATDGTAIYYSGSTFVPGIWKTADKGKNWSRLTEEYGTLYTLPKGELVWWVGADLRFSANSLASYYPITMINQPLRLFPAGNEIYATGYEGGLRRLDSFPKLTDVRAHWAWRYVSRLAETGLISGFPDGTYRPDDSVSRAAALVLLVNAKQIQRQTAAENPFKDAVGHWVSQNGYLGAALKAGIVTAGDFPAGSLGPDQPASRALMARLLVRAAGLESEVTGAVPTAAFADAAEIAPADLGYVAVAVKHGLLTGIPGADGKTYFKPQESLTRAQAATVIYRLIARW